MKIIEEIEQGKSHSQVSRERNIPRSTISTIFKNKFAIKSAFLKSNFSSTLKRDRGGEFPEIEEALFRRIRQANAMKLAINGNILKEKAILLALKMGQDNFEASNGWLEKFKARRNIAFKRLHGEAGSVDANSVATWKGEIIPSLLAKYSPQDIFNADETGLFYKLLPNQTMTIRGEKCEGGFVMDEAMQEVVEEEMNRCFEALKKHQAIDVNYIDFLEVDKDVQVAGEQSIEEIVKEVMGKEEDEERMMPKFPRKKNNNNIREIAQRHCKVKLKLTRNQKCAGAIVSTPAVADRRRPPMPIVAAVIPFSGKVACKITFNFRNSNFKMVELSELSYYRYCRITIVMCSSESSEEIAQDFTMENSVTPSDPGNAQGLPKGPAETLKV
ncbi:hypothetical protein LAZ67_12001658 [Cordylochernes scorpioides]|uniref:HTH CENPB-type domain-containing protein n=1 Tax=Cordylochernes scorpioides TaxID=51811 RepID=A0ABY6L3X6_9ARAC|nr:hypothetical protein LAZ67_12001658 [Cordylochernes scorpioides]